MEFSLKPSAKSFVLDLNKNVSITQSLTEIVDYPRLYLANMLF